MKILAITRDIDTHVQAVEKYLDEPILIYDPMSLSGKNSIAYRFDNHDIEILLGNEVRLDQIDSIWFRKPSYPEVQDFPVIDLYKRFAFEAYLYTAKTLYDLLNKKFWVSDFRNIMRAGNKMLQVQIAHDLNFLVPPMVLTSSSEEAKRFHEIYGNIVTKPVRFEPIQDGDQLKGFFATRIGKDMVIDFSGLELAPAIFQQEVQDKLDIRVTVIGSEVFACEILPILDSANNVDWRVGIPNDELHYKEHFLPESVKIQCLKLVQKFGLQFGAVDLVLDSYGTYWFLEINPNGQWFFVEKSTGQELAKSMANLLKKGNK